MCESRPDNPKQTAAEDAKAETRRCLLQRLKSNISRSTRQMYLLLLLLINEDGICWVLTPISHARHRNPSRELANRGF